MDNENIIKRYAEHVGYDYEELEKFKNNDHCLRQVTEVSKVAARYSIVAEVIKSRHCHSNYKVGDRFILGIDGNFITRLCPNRLCVYLISQLAIPVALINERLSEGLPPNQFHFMLQLDV